MSKKYDYIIAGAGLAGLSLAYKIRKSPILDNKSILLIDKDLKNKNDRTWCYWSKSENSFDHLIYKSWKQIFFANKDFNQSFDIHPYSYNMIRGIDFYKHVISFLKNSPNTEFITDQIINLNEGGTISEIQCTHANYSAEYIFKSYYDKPDFSKSHFVWQHFKGWIIECDEDVFDENQAIFMDFRLDQADETRFFYVLPHSRRKALVEIAIFSKDIPDPSFYDPYLKSYIKNTLQIENYQIEEEEVGAIPMTDYNFKSSVNKKVISIGTNAGRVKGSSGYAYYRIQKDTDKLLNAILSNRLDSYKIKKNRYHFYDSIFLNAILTGKTNGSEVFGNLFKQLPPETIFKFLDEEGTFLNDLKVFTAPPTIPFTKAFFEEILK